MASLIFTVAQNGYGLGYRQCLRSHAAYAARYGHAYVPVLRPLRVPEPALSAWLKIPLLLRALQAGYDWVGFVDADCAIRPSAPDFRTVEARGKSVYMANGRSGRVNSGVIFAKAGSGAIAFLEQVMASVTREVPAADREHLKYENGNVIHCARSSGEVEVMDLRWNNTYQPALADHVRHYTGPLRAEYQRSAIDTIAFKLARWMAATPTAQPETRDAAFVRRLERLCEACWRFYPALTRVPR